MKKLMVGAALAAVALCAAPGARAADQWWPVKVYDMDSGKPVVTDYAPLPKADKPWNVCVLFPHMKDTFWVAVDYGIVEEAKRMGINMTLYEAGGYENLPKQLSQFDDCMAANFDAIIVGPISEAGLTRKMREAQKAGKPVISTVNPLPKAPATAVEIDGEHYWDGGVVSNTPFSRVLSGEPCDTLTFQIDLWSAKGRVPHDMMEVSSRQKDIQYSSRTRAITDQVTADAEDASGVAADHRRNCRKAQRHDPEIRAIADLARHRSYNIIHLIYQSKIYEGHSRDYEFGLSAMRTHWQSGLDDIRRTLAEPRRLDRPAPELGIVTHDVHRHD